MKLRFKSTLSSFRPPSPGKTERIDRMHEQHGGARPRLPREVSAREPRRVAPRSRIPLDAMRARDKDEELLRIRRPNAGDVGIERFAGGAAARILVRRE